MIMIDYKMNSAEELNKTFHYPLDFPNYLKFNYLSLGNPLNDLINYDKDNEHERIGSNLYNIYQLYYGKACDYLYPTKDSNEYKYCEKSMSGIMQKGMIQVIEYVNYLSKNVYTELSDIYNSIDSEKILTFTYKNSSFIEYSNIMSFFVYDSYKIIIVNFEKLKSNKINKIQDTYKLLVILYLIITFIAYIFILFFINKSFILFVKLFNFVNIIPKKFIFLDNKIKNFIIKIGNNYYI